MSKEFVGSGCAVKDNKIAVCTFYANYNSIERAKVKLEVLLYVQYPPTQGWYNHLIAVSPLNELRESVTND